MLLPPEALRTIELNHLEHFIFLPKNLGCSIKELNGLTLIKSGLNTSMFNIAYGTLDKPITSQYVEEVKQAFSNQPFAWWVPQSKHNPVLTNLLLKSGFILETTEHAMICNLEVPLSFNNKTDLLIKPALDTNTLDDFISVLEPYDSQAKVFYKRIDEGLLQAKERLVVGYLNSKPIVIGILFLQGKSAGIFSIITDESFRGNGYGTDIMTFLMNHCKSQGCKSVTLSASSDSGYRIYKRLGFIKIGEFECFEYS